MKDLLSLTGTDRTAPEVEVSVAQIAAILGGAEGSRIVLTSGFVLSVEEDPVKIRAKATRMAEEGAPVYGPPILKHLYPDFFADSVLSTAAREPRVPELSEAPALLDRIETVKGRVLIGSLIRDIRYRHHLSQADLAARLGICRATLNLYEGRKSVPMSRLRDLVLLFPQDPAFLTVTPQANAEVPV